MMLIGVEGLVLEEQGTHQLIRVLVGLVHRKLERARFQYEY
jgi:hypothetical protein